MTNQNLKLKGEYRIRIFDKNDSLKSDSDFLPNLITNSGMLFPFSVAFADSFRYLSLGSGDADSADYTKTGCEKVIPEFQYLGIYNALTTLSQSQDFEGDSRNLLQNYSEDYYYNPEGCGSTLKPDRIELYRTWKVPTGINEYANKNYVGDLAIKELIVSPSAPIEQKMFTGGLSDYLPFTPTGYHNLAFSRIVLDPPFSLSSGDYALVSYRLSLYPQTGVSFYTKTFNSATFSAKENDRIGCAGWTGVLTGIFTQIHPGLKLISNIDGNSYGGYDSKSAKEFEYPYSIPKIDEQKNYFGISYTPLKINCPSEPSVIDKDYFYCYLSDDNEQFLANSLGGAIPSSSTGKYFPFKTNGIKSSGVCKYIYNLPLKVNDSATNIRTTSSSLLWPNPDNITTQAPASPNIRRSTSEAVIIPDYTEHSKLIKFSWQSSNPIIQTVSSLVIGYKDPNDRYNLIYPFFDMLFSSTTGQMIPDLKLGYNPNAYGYYIPMQNTTGSKLFLDGINNLSLYFKLSWTRYT